MQLVGAQTIVLEKPRTFLRTVFRKIGASTPGACGASTPGQAQGHCIVSVLHTPQKINHPNPLEFKLDRDLEVGVGPQ